MNLILFLLLFLTFSMQLHENKKFERELILLKRRCDQLAKEKDTRSYSEYHILYIVIVVLVRCLLLIYSTACVGLFTSVVHG